TRRMRSLSRNSRPTSIGGGRGGGPPPPTPPGGNPPPCAPGGGRGGGGKRKKKKTQTGGGGGGGPPFFSRPHSLVDADAAADEIMIERRQNVQRDQRQQAVIGKQAMHVAAPAPAGRAGGDQLRQLQPEHHDRHAAPGRVDPAEDRQHEQQQIEQPMHDPRTR